MSNFRIELPGSLVSTFIDALDSVGESLNRQRIFPLEEDVKIALEDGELLAGGFECVS